MNVLPSNQFLSVYNGKPLYEETNGLIVGQLASRFLEAKKGDGPTASWNGTDIPPTLIARLASFALWCNKTYRGEVQGRLFYDRKSGEWASVVQDQWYQPGLRSIEIGAEGDVEEARKQLPDGDYSWSQIGTWHSHAFAGASQSSIDLKDEIGQDGVHITLGSFESNTMTIHSRLVHNKICYELADGVGNGLIHKDTQLDVGSMPDDNFPIEWIDHLHEKPKPEFKKITHTVKRGTLTQAELPRIFHPDGVTDSEYEKVKAMMKTMFPDMRFLEVINDINVMALQESYLGLEFGDEVLAYDCQFCGNPTTNDDEICEGCASFIDQQ